MKMVVKNVSSMLLFLLLSATVSRATIVVDDAYIARYGNLIFGPIYSSDEGPPLISIQTQQHVNISYVIASGPADFIQGCDHCDVQIDHCIFTGRLSANLYWPHGVFFKIEHGQPHVLSMYSNQASGINAFVRINNDWVRQQNDYIHISFNVISVDGRPSNGAGGRLSTLFNSTFFPGQTQDDGGTSVGIGMLGVYANIEISWNDFESVVCGDVINLYGAKGFAWQPIMVHDNFIYGPQPSDQNAQNCFNNAIVTDDATADASLATQWVHIYNNHITHCGGAGISAWAGLNLETNNNRVIYCGLAQNGAANGWPEVAGMAQYEAVPGSGFGGTNSMHDNYVSVGPGIRQYAISTGTSSNNAGDNNASLASEQAERALFLHDVAANNYILGPNW